MVENLDDGGADIEHQHAQTAVIFIGASTAFICRLADAADWGERSVNQSNN